MTDIYEPRPGLCMTRIIDGEKVNLSKMPAALVSRMDVLGEMNDRYLHLRGAGDKAGLLELANEYDAMKMYTMAGQIRRECGITKK
jgi:hypothetical protein